MQDRTMTKREVIECFFDCSSPWTWIGFRNLRALSGELDVRVHWRPILVGGIFNAVNPSVYASRDNPVPAKAAYMKKDLQDWAGATGIDIVFPPSVFPVNSVKAMRACIVMDAEGKLVDFAERVFHAYWTEDRDISRDDVLCDIASACGVDAEWLMQAIQQPAIKSALKENTDDAIRRGAFGSPTFFVGAKDMYFGNDRLPLVRRAVLQSR